MTEDRPLDDTTAGYGRHEAAATGSSLMRLIQRIQTQHQMIGDLVATEAEQIQRLKDDVGGYVSAMRTKVQSLQDQITNLGGQVSSAAADQMGRDAQDLSDSLDTLEQAFAQDVPPAAPATPADPGTGGTTDPNAPPA